MERNSSKLFLGGKFMKPISVIEEEVISQVQEVSKIKLGTEESKIAVDSVSKLAGNAAELRRLELEERQMEYEHQEKMRAQDIEIEKINNERKDQRIKNGLTFAGVVLPIGAAIWANVYNWTKEENGVMTYSFGKKAMDFLSRLKK